MVGHYTDMDGKTHGYLLRKKKFTTIDPPGATSSQAHGINPAGDIVGLYKGADGKRMVPCSVQDNEKGQLNVEPPVIDVADLWQIKKTLAGSGRGKPLTFAAESGIVR